MYINTETIYYGKEFHSNVPVSTLHGTKLFENTLTVLNEKAEIKERKGSEFYDKIKFLILQLVIVGLIPVCKPGEGLKTRLILIFSYCVLIYTTMTCLIWFEFKKVHEEMSKSSNLQFNAQSINRLLFLSQHFLSLFSIWPQSVCMIKNFSQWSEYQDQYEQVTRRPFKLNNINNCLKFSIFNLIVITPINWYHYRYLNVGTQLGFWQTFLYCYINHLMMTTVLVWYFIARAGEVVTEDFLEQLMQKFNKYESASELQTYRLLWLKMSQVVCGAGAIFSIPVTQLLLYLFFNIVVHTYVAVLTVTTIVETSVINYKVFLKALRGQVFVMGFLFTICLKGYTVSKQNQIIKRHLIDMRIHTYLLNQAAMAELRVFIRSINLFPMEFSIRGFQIVNQALLASILGNVVTYIIILVQFNLTLQDLSSRLTCNSTLNITKQ